MHEAQFSEAVRPDMQAVLRLPLLPYSIGHEILLMRLGNPLVTMGAESFKELPLKHQRSALIRAVLVCYRNWKGNQRPERWLWLWGWFCKKCDTAKEVEKFQAYRKAGINQFQTKKMPRTPGAQYHYFGSPEIAMLLLFVQQHRLHEMHGIGSPYDFPISLARMLHQADAESRGEIWVQNWHDWQSELQAKEYERTHPESTLAIGNEAVKEQARKWNKEHPECPVPEE